MKQTTKPNIQKIPELNVQITFDTQKGWRVRPAGKALGRTLGIEWLEA